MEITENGITYTGDDFNQILRSFDEISFLSDEGKFQTINEQVVEDSYEQDLIRPLIGYQVMMESEGDHRHDGQMVDYYFTFVSPKNVKTEISTEMCLMAGWNHWENVIIK